MRPEDDGLVIAGALSWIGRWYQSGGEYSAAQVAEQCIGTLMHGVLGPAAWRRRTAGEQLIKRPASGQGLEIFSASKSNATLAGSNTHPGHGCGYR